MLLFWTLATLMTAVAVALVLVPLVRARRAAGPTLEEANLAVLRGQRQEIEADVARGVLPADARDEALAELVDRADAELTPEAVAVAPPQKRSWAAAALVAVALPALAFGMYFAVGNPNASDPKHFVQPGPAQDAQIVAMVEGLAAKVRERPDDAKGWSLLARSMAALGRYEESAKAYDHLVKLQPNDPQVLADYADSLGMAQGRRLAGKPYQLAKAALAIDPTHRKSLALAATAAMDEGDYGGSLRYWQSLAAIVPADSEDAKQVQMIIAEVRTRAEAVGQKPPTIAQKAPTAGEAAAKPAPAPTARSVAGLVTLAPEIAAKVGRSDTLYIFARAEGGGRAPLAVMRATAAELPLQFALDDSMAMSPQMRLSQADAVRIEARISKSGNAVPQPGDLVGKSAVVKPGARDVKIVVSEVLP